jgi:hypothetical protein
MLKFTFNSKWEAIESLISGNGELLERGKAGKFVVCDQPLSKAPKVINQRRVSRALKEFAFVTPDYLRRESDFLRPNAFAFAHIFLGMLRKEDWPIVFFTKFEAIIGRRAIDALQRMPDRIQYLCRSTAKRENGSNTLDNLQERLFVNVEFDDMPPEEQLALLWYLKARRGWRLISITFSGNESYHGLFYVRGMSEERVSRMKAIAVSLGVNFATKRRLITRNNFREESMNG